MDRPKQLSNPTEYSVGFITALANELTAVEAMLDEEHGSPLNFIQHERDDNCYTWGRMGVHNVVIASLPEGRYGLVSAATTAYSLLSSLPHLRIGLMVGIGAGIPKLQTNIDIRLGDVVVSQPTDQSSGVFQYDLGKKRQDGTFQHVGSLAPPPTVLLTGLQKLKAKRRRKGSELPYILEEMLRRSPKLAEPDDDDPAFVYQGSHNDRLFESSVPHVEMTAEKNTAAGLSKSTQTPSVENRNAEEAGLETGNCVLCDRAGEVTRKERRSTDPVVHYGIIASGNSVMKNSLCRDEISRQIDDKCICFEMEAAGLMNTFPCLVIRGICDYADSHKNNRWQNYAAATAATFSKELLHVIDAVDVSKSPNMKQIVDRMLENISQLTSDAKEANQGLQQLNDNKLSENIKNWLSPCDLWETHNSTLERRQDGTGNWFLDSDSYASWKENSKFSVWVHGKPGCGKTTLCSTIIDDDPATLRRELNALPDDLANTYAAILKRIPKRSEEQSIRILQFLAFSERPLRVKEAVDLLAVELKEKPGFNPNNRMPIPEEITGYCSGLVVIGYTDEHRGDMEIQLAHATVKEYLISDRLSQDVSAHFATSVAKAATSITEVCLAYLSEVKLVSPPNIEDLNFYKDKDAVYYLNVWPPWYHYKPFRGVALDGFIKMRYPFAQYAADYWMRHAFHANTSQVETQVKKFIDCEIFHRLYEHSAENSSALYRMAQEGLTWAIELLLEKDATLLNAREDESLLAAAIQHRHDNTFHVLLARGAKVDRTAIVCASSRGDEELVRPLIGKVTAANAWKWCSKAAKAACAEGHVEILHMILEKCEEANIMCCIEGEWICDAFKGGHNAVVMALLDSPPHATFYAQSWRSACENGLCGLVEILLAKDTDADAAGRRTEALSIATDKGHVEIVKLLLKNGVGIGKAVFFAAIGNREEILKLLLENGGSPNTTHRSETALQAACYRGHKNIVQILLEFGASDKDLFGPLGSAFQSA
ncbi:Ankyrin repeat domain-containing protein 17 [Colletotrichum fructicola]|nr:Ankyrin repeat domain-containing protein 17 [Colletotrichum fructicola]KAF4912730.1 Ankyrin repeat domain-containing protein 17 [Colletotrichum fructicola]KAF4940629.1 Ankyrin repeat domain-containing protein 17 [Colletotrichum fructicola]